LTSFLQIGPEREERQQLKARDWFVVELLELLDSKFLYWGLSFFLTILFP
jgi:hypothetical protein